MASNVVASANPPGGRRVRRGEGFREVRLASWNIRSLTDKSIELVKSLLRLRINIVCPRDDVGGD